MALTEVTSLLRGLRDGAEFFVTDCDDVHRLLAPSLGKQGYFDVRNETTYKVLVLSGDTVVSPVQ